MYYPPPAVMTPVVAAPPLQLPGAWTTGLFNCFDDPWSCCITAIFPGATFGKIANIIDRGMTSRCSASCTYFFLLHCNAFTMGLTPWLYTCMYRKKLRMAYNLREEPCCDCAVQYFCEACSLCQMYRELQNRGFDMSKDYRENMEHFARNNMPPPMMAPPIMQPPPMQFIHPPYVPYQQQTAPPMGQVTQRPVPITEAQKPAMPGTPSSH